ncbi:MAG TPA: hypothetical protein VLV29_10705, partial [Steroidobacteraceae bacterium]|nr:hypothetical protein [Steroidobacteraceae bacterium]
MSTFPLIPAAPAGEQAAQPAPGIARPTLGERVRFAALVPFDFLLQVACVRFETFLALFERLAPAFLDWAGRWRARRAFYRAAREVPAYRAFLAGAGFKGGEPPQTDKENYVRRYSTEQRCVGGALPERDVTIDESSGSTGTPYNWVRSGRERHQSHIFISYFA